MNRFVGGIFLPLLSRMQTGLLLTPVAQPCHPTRSLSTLTPGRGWTEGEVSVVIQERNVCQVGLFTKAIVFRDGY
ncbi:hypothetical protein CEXT_193791 [Caerostris extrusa]|uniref:Secreted protein n=1 Tax=Caerostris extrusa TaxID=172846 RepID=A0AAV4VWQ1_CAEEX|nr:hypothetical protein CEXT_193791 [Caerostris extrusa]